MCSGDNKVVGLVFTKLQHRFDLACRTDGEVWLIGFRISGKRYSRLPRERIQKAPPGQHDYWIGDSIETDTKASINQELALALRHVCRHGHERQFGFLLGTD